MLFRILVTLILIFLAITHPAFASIRKDARFIAALSRLDAAAADARNRAVEEGLL